MRYDWNQQKANLNFKKHGVSFELATTVFDDPHHLSSVDGLSSIGKERWATIGFAADKKSLVVIHTYATVIHGEEVIPIISARKATRREKRQYEEGI